MQSATKNNELPVLLTLMCVLTLAFALPPFLTHGEVLMRVFLGCALICSAYLVRAMWISLPLLALSAVVIIAAFLLANPNGDGPHPLLYYAGNATFLLFVIICFIYRIFTAKRVDTALLLIAMSVYLGLAAFCAMLFGLIDFFAPGSVHLPSDTVSISSETTFMYFSVVTLSTLGYGDVFPVTEQARTIAALEAMTGQIFLTFVVARLVGMHVATQSQSSTEK